MSTEQDHIQGGHILFKQPAWPCCKQQANAVIEACGAVLETAQITWCKREHTGKRPSIDLLVGPEDVRKATELFTMTAITNAD